MVFTFSTQKNYSQSVIHTCQLIKWLAPKKIKQKAFSHQNNNVIGFELVRRIRNKTDLISNINIFLVKLLWFLLFITLFFIAFSVIFFSWHISLFEVSSNPRRKLLLDFLGAVIRKRLWWCCRRFSCASLGVRKKVFVWQFARGPQTLLTGPFSCI